MLANAGIFLCDIKGSDISPVGAWLPERWGLAYQEAQRVLGFFSSVEGIQERILGSLIISEGEHTLWCIRGGFYK